MKFLQLLGKELNEWPPKADWAVFVISTRGEARASFGCGGKPKPDPSDRKFHTWSVCEPETNANWLGVYRVLSEKASDQLTAIVTRADWEAERAKLKAPKANGDGWIRHRGGKCPVEAGTLVDVRYRDGVIHYDTKAMVSTDCEENNWVHEADKKSSIATCDIMAYRIHKPAEQPVNQVDPSVVVFDDQICVTTRNDTEFPFKPAVNPIEWRNRIRELDTQRAEVEATDQRQVSEITQERESLVQKLAGEGLALVEVVVQPVEDMSDWRNWRVGDLLEVVLRERGHDFRIGEVVRMKQLPDSRGGCIRCEHTDSSDWWSLHESELKWHSRPAT